MRILLLQSSAYIPSLGGANKANRLLLEQLAAHGHQCHVVGTASGDGAAAFRHAGVQVEAVRDGARLRAHAAARLRELAPDRVLVSSEDPAQVLLEEALEASPHVVYLAHTTLHLPFGPDGFLQSPGRMDLLRRAAGIVAVSGYVRDYILRWAGLESTLLRFPVYGDGPFPDLGDADRGFVTLINPCAVKGISIFLELARRLPAAAFAAVPTWGTTAEDLEDLAALPNVRILPATAAIDEIFGQTRVLVAPSLWGEAFGQVAVEAMLRGIPVLASDAGGLPEAKLGVDYVLPVRPIQRYEERFDERKIPIAVIPEQDLGPWEETLRRLLADRELYGRLSGESRRAAHEFVAGLGTGPFERFLADLAAVPPKSTPPAEDVRQKLAGLSAEKLELLARRLKKKDGAAPPVPGIPRLPRSGAAGGDRFRLSFAQQRLWFLDRLEPGSLAYNEHFAILLAGRFEVPLLAAALDQIGRRHEVLRTVYAEEEDEPVQIVLPIDPDGHSSPPVADLGALPAAARRSEAARRATAESRRPFDLERGPVIRTLLLRLGAEEHLLLITAHHIAVDNWSATVLFTELSALYGALEAGTSRVLPELSVQYADFAVWQRDWLVGATLEGQISFWRDQLAGAPARIELPTDRPRPARQSFRGTRTKMRFSPHLAEALRGVARRRDATPYMLLLAVFHTLLHRITGQDDLVVGTPVAGRNRREIEPLIGCFLNTLPLRARLDPGLRFTALLDQVRRTALDAFTHQDLPFERLVEELAPERSLSHPPLFQVLFNFLNVPPRNEALSGGARLTAVTVQSGATRFDLELYMEEQEQGLATALVYNTDLFDAATMARLLGHLETLLAGVSERPDGALSALPLLTAAECHQMQREWNDTEARSELPEGPGVHQLFAAQALRSPDAPAVAFQGSEITYAELAARARSLAAHLRNLGCGPETRVGVALERGLDIPVALLGILETGAAYVPLDPGYPRERLAFVLEDAAPRVLITRESLLPALPRAAGTVLCLGQSPLGGGMAASTPFDDRQLAYVLYTSGSTGRPKGVGVPHRALGNFLGSMRQTPGFAPGERLLAVTSLAFDIAALEIFLPLTTGGCVELVSRDEAADGALLSARLRASRPDVLQGTPATWRMLLDSGWDGDPALQALCGGEALPRHLAATLAGCTRELWNLYGPTETTVWSAAARIRPGEAGPVSIGPPIAATRIHLLDRDLQTVPQGVPGELWIGGAGLARGYLGRPDLTAERFRPDPLAAEMDEPGGRLYRTGDLARHLPGGRMEVLGRIDHQVKLRGFRIELGEIEAALARHPAVREVVVTLRGGALVAYLVPAGVIPAAGTLRDFLRVSLPEPMLPTTFVSLAALPLTPNRKVDRKALPAPDPVEITQGFLAPRTPVEEVLAGIWAEVLGRERIGVHDSFFDLGGHSLLAARVVSRLRGGVGVELPLRALFEDPTLAGLARRIERTIASGEAPHETPIERVPRDGELPLSFAQQRLWVLDQLAPGSAAFNIAAAVRLEGLLDPVALEVALGEIERRHEVLRTTFPTRADLPVQLVAPAAVLHLPHIDLAGLPMARRESECGRLAREEARIPFDLVCGPVWRTALVRMDREDHALFLTLHHIAGDAWSLGVLVRELGALYAAFSQGRLSPLPDLPVQFADFAAWQRCRLDGDGLAPDLTYWRERLAGAPALVLPADLPYRPEQPVQPACLPVVVGAELTQGLAALARAASATLFMAVLAAFQAVLALHTGRRDLVVGSNVANRNRLEIEGLIGCFINVLVLRTDLTGNPTFEELLHRVRAVTLGAFAHQELPFDRLVQELEPSRAAGRTPLFQVKVDLLPAAPPVELSALRLRLLDTGRIVARYDLHLALQEEDGELRGDLLYDAGRFAAATVGHLGVRFGRLLAEAVRTPGARLSELAQRLDAAESAERQERRQELGRANLASLRQIPRRPLPGVTPNLPVETKT